MKYTISVLLIAFPFACDSSQPVEVKTLKQVLVFESRFDAGKETKPRLVERKVYDEKGWLLSEVTYEESGAIDCKNDYVYDLEGRKVKDTYFLGNKCNSISEFIYKENDSLEIIVVYKPDMEMDFTIQPCYNKKGFNYLDICSGADHKLRFWDTCKRDNSGRVQKWIRFNPDSTVQSKVIYQYDRKGREIKNVCSGELGGTYFYKYNKKGLLSEEIGRNTADHRFLWLKVFRYDRHGRIAKTVEYSDSKHRPKRPFRILRYTYEFWDHETL